MERLTRELKTLEEKNRYRTLKLGEGVDFCSNDYLAISSHPRIYDVLKSAIARGVPIGSGGSRLLRGNHEEHELLESKAAEFFGFPNSIYFASGFDANYAIFSTLPSRKDAVILDEKIHASVKEGVRASFAEKITARHNDLQSFEDALGLARARGAKDLFIAVEALYSMDGDLAPLPELLALAEKFNAHLIVDEAHSVGVFGKFGRGLSEDLPKSDKLITVYPCGKAIGVSGALVCCSNEIRDYLVNQSRIFQYSTAPSPLIALAVSRSLEVINEEPWRREALLEKVEFAIEQFRAELRYFRLLNQQSQILPIVIGSSQQASEVGTQLRSRGWDVREIRPPTVPEHSARLRVSIRVTHQESEISGLAKALGEVERQYEN